MYARPSLIRSISSICKNESKVFTTETYHKTKLLKEDILRTTQKACFFKSSDFHSIKERQAKRLKAENEYRKARLEEKGFRNRLAVLQKYLDELEARKEPESAEGAREHKQLIQETLTKISAAETSLRKAGMKEEKSFALLTLLLQNNDKNEYGRTTNSGPKALAMVLTGAGLGLFGSLFVESFHEEQELKLIKQAVRESIVSDVQNNLKSSINSTIDESLTQLQDYHLVDSKYIANDLYQLKRLAERIDKSVTKVNRKSIDLDRQLDAFKRKTNKTNDDIERRVMEVAQHEQQILSCIGEVKQELVNHINTSIELLTDRVGAVEESYQPVLMITNPETTAPNFYLKGEEEAMVETFEQTTVLETAPKAELKEEQTDCKLGVLQSFPFRVEVAQLDGDEKEENSAACELIPAAESNPFATTTTAAESNPFATTTTAAESNPSATTSTAASEIKEKLVKSSPQELVTVSLKQGHEVELPTKSQGFVKLKESVKPQLEKAVLFAVAGALLHYIIPGY